MSIPKSSLMDFWYMNPGKLLEKWNMLPSTSESRSEQANSAMRLTLYLSLVLFLCGLSVKLTVITLVIGIMMSIIFTGGLLPEDVEHYLNESNSPETNSKTEKEDLYDVRDSTRQSNDINVVDDDDTYEDYDIVEDIFEYQSTPNEKNSNEKKIDSSDQDEVDRIEYDILLDDDEASEINYETAVEDYEVWD